MAGKQHGYENNKGNAVLPGARKVSGSQRLDKAETCPGNDGARYAAHATEHDNGEGLQRIGGANGWNQRRDRRDQHSGEGRKPDAEPEGEAIYPSDVDTEDRRGIAVFRRCTHLLADRRTGEKSSQQDENQQTTDHH